MEISARNRAQRPGILVGGSVFGGLLIVAGLGMAYLALATPFATALSAHQLSGAGRLPIAFGWSLCLVAGAGLLLAGTYRLVLTIGQVRAGDQSIGPGARALAAMSAEVDVVAGAILNDGQAIQEFAIGAFGVAVISALPANRKVKVADGAWLSPDGRGWVAMESPVERVTRDADRVRRWLAAADLDFVVRVHAALLVNDESIPRFASCAVMTPGRLSAWIAALPRQRTLTAARRLRLRAFAIAASRPGAR